VGRRFYAFHVTFEDQPALYQLADAYRTALADRPAVTLIPDQWLHLTMQGIGFTDEVPLTTAVRIAEQGRAILADMPEFEVEFGDIVVSDEAIVLPAEPAEPLQQLRTATRTAIGRVFGDDQVPEDPDRYRPHVSVGYIAADGPANPYLIAVQAVRRDPVRVRISHVDLIEMHRDHRMYEWALVSPLPLD
jgi:2'-5' RNA ligase